MDDHHLSKILVYFHLIFFHFHILKYQKIWLNISMDDHHLSKITLYFHMLNITKFFWGEGVFGLLIWGLFGSGYSKSV
jgi:hypothetical protein